MKTNQVYGIALIALFLLSSNRLYSQDVIRFTDGDSIQCKITKLNSDTIKLKTEVRGNTVHTYIERSKVKSMQIYVLDFIKESNDTSVYYTIYLSDGSILTGQVKEIKEYTITFEDSSLGIVDFEVFDVDDIEKQDSETLYLINLVNGNQLYGKISEKRENEIVFETKSLGIVTIPTANIKKMHVTEEGKMVDGKYWFPNPNNTRYYFAPSAFNLKKGEGYYQNIYFLMNSANYGVTDNFSIGGGIIIPFAVYITPKINFRITEKFYMGTGVLFGMLPETSAVGIAYGLTTYGTNEHNITLGVGYGFFEEDFSERPIISLNGMTRISRQLALVTENWSIPFKRYEYDEYNWQAPPKEKRVYDTYFSYGLRMMFGEKITVDVALVNSKDIVEFLPVGIPYVDFVLKFN